MRALAKRSYVEWLKMAINPMQMTEWCARCAHCVINKSRKTKQNGVRVCVCVRGWRKHGEKQKRKVETEKVSGGRRRRDAAV